MRILIVVIAALLSSTTSGAAQTRWTLSAGPEWGQVTPANNLWGLRLRAEYDLTSPNSVFGLRLEGGTRWSPTQSYYYSDEVVTWAGSEQKLDLMLGLNASLSPIPHAPVSPYVAMGIFGRQAWMHGSRFFRFGSDTMSSPVGTYTGGDIIGSLGVGVRARLGGRTFQLELRRLHYQNGLTLGTRLPF